MSSPITSTGFEQVGQVLGRLSVATNQAMHVLSETQQKDKQALLGLLAVLSGNNVEDITLTPIMVSVSANIHSDISAGTAGLKLSEVVHATAVAY